VGRKIGTCPQHNGNDRYQVQDDYRPGRKKGEAKQSSLDRWSARVAKTVQEPKP